jgi:hypothetical protein
MNRKTTGFENCLIAYAAPTLAGVKTGSLFRYICAQDEEIFQTLPRWNARLNGKGIYVVRLKSGPKGHLIYVFRPQALLAAFRDGEVFVYLKQHGYEECRCWEDYISALRLRFEGDSFFPHEIGLFLGYPLHDVLGFIENEGKNFRLNGCWKVYGEQDDARRRFMQLQKCTSVYKRLHDNGKTVLQLTVAA